MTNAEAMWRNDTIRAVMQNYLLLLGVDPAEVVSVLITPWEVQVQYRDGKDRPVREVDQSELVQATFMACIYLDLPHEDLEGVYFTPKGMLFKYTDKEVRMAAGEVID